MKFPKDLSGLTFGRLTVIRQKEKSRWLCECECGNQKVIYRSNLITGDSTSCGCYQKEISTKHKMSNTRIFGIWAGMKKRCYNEKYKQFKNYGGRGIKICDEWKTFINFYEWSLKNGYQEKLTIDRIDNDGNYSPNNCRWVNGFVQNNNTRKNVYVTVRCETLTVSQCARKYGINTRTLAKRVEKGITGEDLIAKPYKTKRKERDII